MVGRRAIDDALDELYPTERDFRMGLSAAPGEDEPPLAEVVAYRSKSPISHWHYITYGLTELGEKVSDDPKWSGWGFELTMRVLAEGDEPERWPINFLRWIAGTVWRDKNPLGSGHTFLLPEGMLDEVRPGTNAVGFVLDDALKEIDTTNGRVQFLQTVPLVGGEYAMISRWDALEMFDAIGAQIPRFVWPSERTSVLDGPHGEALRSHAERDGSSQAVHFASGMIWDDERIHLDGLNRLVVADALQYRVAYGRSVRIVSEGRMLEVISGPTALSLEKESATITLLPADARRIADVLRTGRGDATPFLLLDDDKGPSALR